MTGRRPWSGEDSEGLAAKLRDGHCRVGRSWGGIHSARWRAIEALDDDATILDVGCSAGRYVEKLRARGRIAWGTDLLQDDAWSGSCFFRSDARALPLAADSVDCIIAFEVLEHLPNPAECLREFRRVGRRKLVLSVPNCAVPEAMRRAGVTFHHWVDPTHVNHFTEKSLLALLSAEGFTVESMRLVNPIRPELLVLSTWRVPVRLAAIAVRLLERVPWRVECPMTILATASV